MAVDDLDVVNVVADPVPVVARRLPWVRSLVALISVAAALSLVVPQGRAAWVTAALWCAHESSQAWAAMVPALQVAFTPHFSHA
ncbi:MAG TPA: hypothetical protein VGK17_24030 [Propionicimonas sp.]|jgi:hypothetical protein